MSMEPLSDYGYEHAGHSHAHGYLYAPVADALHRNGAESVLDVGCGNGSMTIRLIEDGFDAVGFDASTTGIEIARQRFPERFRVASTYDDLREVFPNRSVFDALVAVEVIEHLYSPVVFAARAMEVLRPGGFLLLTTPYHGYLKNLVLAITGKLDTHFTALWEGGHIKFWSPKTLRTLLAEAGFVDIQASGAGRLPYIWKSMVVTARKPE